MANYVPTVYEVPENQVRSTRRRKIAGRNIRNYPAVEKYIYKAELDLIYAEGL